VHVNLAEVAFCDLAGLRAVLWLASRKLPLRARRRPSVVCAARTLPRAGSQRRVPERPVTYFLKASLTFSPAFLRSPLAWSACPSASKDSSPVTLPTPSLTLPLAFSAVFLALSSALIYCLHLLLGSARERPVQATLAWNSQSGHGGVRLDRS